MRIFIRTACLLLILAIVSPIPIVLAEDSLGIVLMHGKDGTAKPKSPIGKLVKILEKRNFRVATPDMPWSRSNKFNQDLQGAFKDIDLAIESLKNQGATKIVVGGHSMGAGTALAYAATHPGLAGVLMIAPGHRPDLHGAKNAEALALAKAHIAAGKPDEPVDITDYNQGNYISRSLPAKIAVSWFDPEGLVVMQNAATKLAAGTPVLFIIGEDDRLHPGGKDLIFAKLPANPQSAYQVVPGGHKATPMKGKKEIIEWLKGL